MIYKIGDKGEKIEEIQGLLIQSGYMIPGQADGIYDDLVLAEVKRFQATHLGRNGLYLEVDGIVGPETLWALGHASGKAQRSFIAQDNIIPAGLTPLRQKVLDVAVAEYRKGVKEVPSGSNWGPDIQRYGGHPGWAWCSLFITYCWRVAGIIDFKQPSTYSLWKKAEKQGWFTPIAPLTDYPKAATPGNALLWQHKDSRGRWTRTGHISLIVRNSAIGGTHWNTIGGNEGNRLKLGLRNSVSKDLIGFINPFPAHEQPLLYKVGLIDAKSAEGAGTR